MLVLLQNASVYVRDSGNCKPIVNIHGLFLCVTSTGIDSSVLLFWHLNLPIFYSIYFISMAMDIRISFHTNILLCTVCILHKIFPLLLQQIQCQCEEDSSLILLQ